MPEFLVTEISWRIAIDLKLDPYIFKMDLRLAYGLDCSIQNLLGILLNM